MKSALLSADLQNKRVFLRADLNVPMINDTIISPFRLEKLKPTLDLLIQKKARILIATHRGRPSLNDPHLSTELLVPWFTKNGYSTLFAPTHESAHKALEQSLPGTLVLLENVRFSQEEQRPESPGALAYAHTLKNLGDYYVEDAWATLHTDDVSLTLLPSLFNPEDRTIGLLIERELQGLAPLLGPRRPYCMILGGAKLSKKVPLVGSALAMADTILVLPALAFTFLKAQGISVGQSLVDDELLPLAHDILMKARNGTTQLILPSDILVGARDLTGPLEIAAQIPVDKIGIALGPESLEAYIAHVSAAETIFMNGTMGFFERSDTLEPLKKLLQAVARSNAYSVVGGGDSTAAVNLFNLEQDLSFCSTGGGATVAYITRKKLPGLSLFL